MSSLSWLTNVNDEALHSCASIVHYVPEFASVLTDLKPAERTPLTQLSPGNSILDLGSGQSVGIADMDACTVHAGPVSFVVYRLILESPATLVLFS
jgi:hypothetical protein